MKNRSLFLNYNIVEAGIPAISIDNKDRVCLPHSTYPMPTGLRCTGLLTIVLL